MLIKDLLDPKFKERTIWVPYLDTFEVQFRYISRKEMRAIVEDATESHWDHKTRAEVERPDLEKIAQAFIEKAVVSWRGFTAGILAKMCSVKITDPTVEIPFSPDNALTLVQEAYDFDTFARSIVTDIERFQGEKIEAEKKTSGTSQDG